MYASFKGMLSEKQLIDISLFLCIKGFSRTKHLSLGKPAFIYSSKLENIFASITMLVIAWVTTIFIDAIVIKLCIERNAEVVQK
jgi:hypothetical protein